MAGILAVACVAPSGEVPASSTLSAPAGVPEVGGLVLEEVAVLRVEDGDSMVVLRDGSEVRARLQGINAPEIDECLGDEAGASLRELVGSRPAIGWDRDDPTDQYGRLIVHVFSGDTYVNAAQVRRGLAFTMSTEHPLRSDLVAAQNQAISDRVGVWSAESCGGGPIADLEIAEVEADPPGPDDELMDEEWVRVENVGDVAIDLDGYVLRDESTVNRFVFDSVVLSPGESVTVVSGCNPSSDRLGWCADRPVWNNGGDTAILLDPAGRVISIRTT